MRGRAPRAALLLRSLGAARALALAAATLPLAAWAQPGELATLFPSQAPVEVPATGRLVRLDLPAEVLAACRPDLSDLRLFDAAGSEVPFVIESSDAAGRDGRVEAVTVVAAEILEAERATEERERAPLLRRESYVLSAPRAPPAGTGWDLVLAIGAGDFTSRVVVRAAEAGAVAGDATDRAGLLAAGSVFRLREIGAEKLSLALPHGLDHRLAVTLESEAPGFLAPAFRYESRRRLEGVSDLETPLGLRSQEQERGVTTVELERPAGLVPARLRFASSTPFFRRPVEVWDEGAGARENALGRGLVYRVAAAASVEELEIPIAPPRGESLRVVIEDGSSPPLADLRFSAVLARPALLFALPAGASDAAGDEPARAVLRFGGGRAFRPRYDVAALPPGLPATGERARIGEALYDVGGLPAARLGAIAPNPRYDPQPILAWAQRPGAEIDRRLWSHRRPLEVVPSPEGLSRLRLAVEDLGAAQSDLADLRVVDAEDRQWAILIERDAARETRPLAIEGPRVRDRTSSWTLTPPAAPALVHGLALDVAVPYFDRPFALTAVLDGEERVAASGRLVRAAGDPRPVRIALGALRFDRLVLEVEDGDDAPLEVSGVAASFPVADVFFAAPAGDYALLVGHPEAEAPSYDLARARAVVLAVRAAPVEAAALEPNRAFSAGARLAAGEGWQQALLWGAIVVLVVFLTVLTLRLARQHQ